MPRPDNCLSTVQAQSSVWNRLIFINNYLMLLHSLNEVFRADWTWICDCRASEYFENRTLTWVTILKNMLNVISDNFSTAIPLFRIAWHFWTNTKYSGKVSLIISLDIHRELTQCVRTWIFSKCRKHWDFTRYAQARQSLLLLTQGNIYNRLRFLNKYLLFWEELNELFREN